MRNLDPGIHRQRMVIEGITDYEIGERHTRILSRALADGMHMNVLHLDISYAAPFGIGATCHWQYSGWALMVWQLPDGGCFFSLDLHSCQPYNYTEPVAIVQAVLRPREIEYAPVLPSLAAGWRPQAAGLRPVR